jgi:hypothetical protein
MLVDDLNLDALRDEYGGLDSKIHGDVQTLIALAAELRIIEKALGSMHRGARPARRTRGRTPL